MPVSLPSSCNTHPTLMVFHCSLSVLASMCLLHTAQHRETVCHEVLLAVEPYALYYVSQLIDLGIVLVHENSQMHSSKPLVNFHIPPLHHWKGSPPLYFL